MWVTTGGLAQSFTRRHGLHAAQDLVAGVVLEQIPLHAERDRGIEHRLLGTDSEKDDIDRQSRMPYPPGQRHAIHLRHADIDDGDIRLKSCHIFPGVRAIPGLGDHLEPWISSRRAGRFDVPPPRRRRSRSVCGHSWSDAGTGSRTMTDVPRRGETRSGRLRRSSGLAPGSQSVPGPRHRPRLAMPRQALTVVLDAISTACPTREMMIAARCAPECLTTLVRLSWIIL